MIAYYNPNFNLVSFLKALFVRNAEQKIIQFFKDYTNKKYILLTNSCRSALFISYKSIPIKGEVITNPLTCSIALEPIIKSGNSIVYTDIDKDVLTMQTDDLKGLINERTIAIQANHQGGFLCNMEVIKNTVGSKRIYIIEDCAQGLFSLLNNYKPGEFSDVVCFSLIKNAYGIGGGILATNDLNLYEKACKFNASLNRPSLFLIFFRIVRNFLETKRKYSIFNLFYNKLMQNRDEFKHYKSHSIGSFKINTPSKIEISIAYHQIRKAIYFNKIRIKKGLLLLEKLKNAGLIINYSDITGYDSSFTKFFMINPKINSEKIITALNVKTIEAKHLEQKYNHFYQNRLDNSQVPELISNINQCTNYMEYHDKLISLPLTEWMSEKQMDYIVKTIKIILGYEK